MRYYRKVIRIRAVDSPNVRLALQQQRDGLTPTGEVLVPGVLTWADYCKRLATWDPVRQCIGLDAQFYEGAEILLFPPQWLNRAEGLADALRGKKRQARAIGCDPAEGGDKTAWAVVDEMGLIELVSKQTSDTAIITGDTLALMRKYGVDPGKVCFDRGGGGKEHADRLRAQGYKVKTVAFGESVTLDTKRGAHPLAERKEIIEERYTYKSRRIEMFHSLSLRLDPSADGPGFAIPAEHAELRRQLSVMPKLTDEEGRYWMLPKSKRDKNDTRQTLVDLIGHSPDEADALVLAVHAMTHKAARTTVGAF